MKELYKIHAEMCKTLANSKRLEIINALRNSERTVSELVKQINSSQSNLSQHLAILRQSNIVTTKREGKNIHYKLAYPEMIKACDIIRNILFKQLKEKSKLFKKLG